MLESTINKSNTYTPNAKTNIRYYILTRWEGKFRKIDNVPSLDFKQLRTFSLEYTPWLKKFLTEKGEMTRKSA